MAYYGIQNPISGSKAAADLSSYQFRFVKYSAGKVTYCTATGEQAIGVLQDTPAAANRAACVSGFNGNITKVEAGAAVSAGADLMTDTVGRAITWTSTYAKLGIAISAATAAGQIIDVLMLPTGTDMSGAKGTIPLDILGARELDTADTQNLAAHGGIMASDSTPALARVNAGTDIAMRLTWASSDSTVIAFPTVVKPQDLDSASDLTVHLWAGMAGATDTPTITLGVFDGVGDTTAGGATGALSDTAGEVSVTVAAADVAAAPGFLNVDLTPGAHTTDALYLYAAWIEYARIAN